MTTSSPSSRVSPAGAEQDVLVIGEALVDIVDGDPRPGGSPANVAVALGRQGFAVTLATQLGDDEYGALVRAHLEASHVAVVAAPVGRTSSAAATLDSSGAATYDFDITWDPSFDELPQARLVHVGSFSALAVDIPEGTLSYDVNVRADLMPPEPVPRVEAIVARSTIVKASDEDLEWLYPNRSPEASAIALQTLGPTVVWVTRGGQGATAFTESGRVEVEAPTVAVVDTIGAGDTFAAGLIVGWLRWGDDWQRVGSFAAQLAAGTTTRRGADPPWAEGVSPASA
ncbi:MAG TPA: carbohydrate kinase [Nocardioidaceae bacterium]|nr:carbohydrate kinase [Nocardioidaceae bacterium]